MVAEPEGAYEMSMSRAEHLQWCKERALEYVARGDISGCYASFMSDMHKHPETTDHSALVLGFQLMFTGNLSTAAEMREFIEGFN
ncbi:MAG TPA: hypothetical protein VFO41_03735 [Alphaproteobacteria bacterium]|nr:hypothetical protein [Alphaproteobacteria bacterium]